MFFKDLESEMKISDEELTDNIDELVRLCHDKFIFGLDSEINYKEIDENE